MRFDFTDFGLSFGLDETLYATNKENTNPFEVEFTGSNSIKTLSCSNEDNFIHCKKSKSSSVDAELSSSSKTVVGVFQPRLQP